MIEFTSNYYTPRELWQAVASRFKMKPELEQQVEVLQPVFMPRTDVERAVYAALVMAGEPVNNRRLAELMRCSPAHASRCVAHPQIPQGSRGDDLTELNFSPTGAIPWGFFRALAGDQA